MEKPVSGTIELPEGDDLGRVGWAVHRQLKHLQDTLGFERCYYEQPIPPSQMTGKTQLVTIAKAFCIASHIESYCYAMEIRCRYVGMGAWRRSFVGKGAGEKTATFKDWAMRRCREFGFNPRFHDEADAIGILDHAIGLADILPPWRDGKLLQEFSSKKTAR